MVGVALPSIRTDLGLSTSSLQWVVSAYVLGYGGFLLLGGRAADLLGRRKVFLISLGVFVVASLLGGFAHDGNLLIATRFIKGMSAAFTAPAGLSIITTSFAEGKARNKALSVYTATGATGFSLGLVIGGLLDRGRLALGVLPARPGRADRARRRLQARAQAREARDPARRLRRRRRRLDHGRDAAARLHARERTHRGLDVGPHARRRSRRRRRCSRPSSIREQSTATPLVRLGILRSGSLVRANLGAMTLFGSWVGFQFIATLYLQQLRDWSPLDTGLAIFPGGLHRRRHLDADGAARHALRHHEADRHGLRLADRGLHALPADRPALELRRSGCCRRWCSPASASRSRSGRSRSPHRAASRRTSRGSQAACSTRPSSSAARSCSPSRRPSSTPIRARAARRRRSSTASTRASYVPLGAAVLGIAAVGSGLVFRRAAATVTDEELEPQMELELEAA